MTEMVQDIEGANVIVDDIIAWGEDIQQWHILYYGIYFETCTDYRPMSIFKNVRQLLILRKKNV